MTQVLTQVCNVADFNAAEQTCSAPYWAVINTGLLPPLSPGEAFQIAAAVWGLWALAWLLRPIVRAMSPRAY